MRFFLGVHETVFMERTEVPLFVSRNRLAKRKRLPVPIGPWALDSGGFTELQHHGRWRITAAEYAEEVRRYAGMGGLVWAAPQDWMCEPIVIKGGRVRDQVFVGTALSVEEHQRRTVANLLDLRSIAPDLPWMPVLQGWTLRDYIRHVEMYRAAGVDLTAEPVVGVGSVCRRQHTNEVAGIIGTLATFGLRLHGFGLKTAALGRVSRMLASADSMSWSANARRRPPLPGCAHRNCGNCLRYALLWRENVLRKIEAAPLSLFDLEAA